MAIQKGEKMVLQKLENFTNKDIIKEEAESFLAFPWCCFLKMI